MKHVDTRCGGLHLVTAADTPKPEVRKTDTQRKNKMAQIGEAVLRFKTLQDEYAEEALSAKPDLEHVGQIIMELNLVREELRAHGVQVQG